MENGPIKVGYTSDLALRQRHLSYRMKCKILMLRTFPVADWAAFPAERYSHFLLRAYHFKGEWFTAPVAEADRAIPKVIEAAERGFPLMPSLWKAGRIVEDGEKVQNLRLPAGSLMAIEAVLRSGEVRSDFIRAAVAAELQRREVGKLKRSIS